MQFSEEEIKEFTNEALELLDGSESSLLSLDGGGAFQINYDALFRAFHSIKGGAGMVGLEDLQSHMHQLENLLTPCKEKKKITKAQIDFFLRGVDAARGIIEGKKVAFNYTIQERTNPPQAPAPAASAKVIPIPPKRKTNKSLMGKVLVVDDEKDIIEILKDFLNDAGFEVVEKTDSTEALTEIGSINPDVVVTDIAMPKMTGMQLLEEIHKINSDLPVIILSGYVTKEVLLESIEKGVYSVLEKPFDEKMVIQAVANAAKRYQLLTLLNRTMNLVLYQFSDLDDFLKATGKEEIRNTLSSEVNALLDQRRKLKELQKKAA